MSALTVELKRKAELQRADQRLFRRLNVRRLNAAPNLCQVASGDNTMCIYGRGLIVRERVTVYM